MRSRTLLFPLLLLTSCISREVPGDIMSGIYDIIQEKVPDRREGRADIYTRAGEGKSIILNGETDNPDLKKELNSFIASKGYSVADSIVILPDASVTPRTWGLITVSLANMKSTPFHTSEMVSQAVMGTPVRLLRRNGSWLLVQTPDKYLGWVNDSGIREMTIEELEEWKSSERVIYLEKTGDIYSDISCTGVVSDVLSGSLVGFSGKAGDLYIVTLPDGRKGFIPRRRAAVFSSWCSTIKPDTTSMTEFARSMTGYPYMWGGTSAKAPDCSGFMKTIWFMQGVILARDASQQFLYGTHVDFNGDFNELMPGDLLFFGSGTPEGKKRITHVGLYIGDTKVIHSSGMVRINSLDSTRPDFSPYLLSTYQGARRYIGNPDSKGIRRINGHEWYNNVSEDKE